MIPYTTDDSPGFFSKWGTCFVDPAEKLTPSAHCYKFFSYWNVIAGWDVFTSIWAFKAIPYFCWHGGWGIANPILFLAWVVVMIILVILQFVSFFVGLIMLMLNLVFVLLGVVLCYCWMLVMGAICAMWHLIWAIVILLVWIVGALIWLIELIVMTCIAICVYPTMALPSEMRWLPWVLIMVSVLNVCVRW